MKGLSRGRYLFGAAVLLAVAALLLAVFSLLSVTDKTDLSLGDTQARRFGWRYEVLAGDAADYEPVFSDGYTLELPEGTEAVRITRTMTEDVPRAELTWMCYQDGVEASLDGDVLHTDFPGLERDGDGFVHPDAGQWERIWREQGEYVRTVRVSLPEDYVGKELSVTTYFPDGAAQTPEYPFLGSEDSVAALYVVSSVRYDAALTVYALLALLMAGVFLLDACNSGGDGRTLLLCLYFLLLFLKSAYSSNAGYYSVLTSRLDLRFLSVVYMAPLYLYLALRMKSRWKWPLCAAVAVWAVYESMREMRLPEGVAGLIGPETLVVLVVVTAALAADGLRRKGRTKQEKKRLGVYALIAAGLTALYMLDRVRAWEGSFIGYFRDELWRSLWAGNCWSVVSLLTEVISWMTVIVVVSEAVRRTLRTHRTVDVLRERERQTMAGYERLLASGDATRALHHEMRHHMLALSAILADGDTARARRYVDGVAEDLAQVPTGRYCQNILVDMIAGSFLDRAVAEGIRVEHHLNVPQELNIADEDLSVFLSNMLQNALEACQRMERSQERYIWADMHLRGNFLCVQCVNSAPEGDQPRERPGHGYGLAAMRAVAEKYNSALLIERTPNGYSVTSDFCLEKL